MATITDYLQPAGGGVPVQNQPVANPLQGSTTQPTTSTATSVPKTTTSSAKDFSSQYGLYNGTVYDKSTHVGFTSDAEFKAKTGVSSSGQKFDTSYVPPSILNKTTQPITTADLEKTLNAPDPSTLVAGQTGGVPLSQKVGAVAATALSGVQQTLDSLQQQREKLIEDQKTSEQANIDKYTAQLDPITKSTMVQDALQAARDKFQVDKQIAQYSDIQNKIVAASEALNMGLIYESDRPARMDLILGRSASLQKQGLATIGALQGVAAVIKGSIDLATSYAETTINAMLDDDKRQMDALSTLLALHENNLVELKKEEKDIVDTRIATIQSQIDETKKNKDDVLTLMTQYPDAFLSGGVTLLDTKETALKKMLPKLAEIDRLKLAKQLKDASGGGITKAQEQTYKGQLLNFKSNGMTYQEAINGFGDKLDISYINQVYGRTSSNDTSEEVLKNQYYGQFLDNSGNVKQGVSVDIDPKNGRLVVTGGGSSGSSSGGFWNGVKSFFGFGSDN